jgi:hypothetical protein
MVWLECWLANSWGGSFIKYRSVLVFESQVICIFTEYICIVVVSPHLRSIHLFTVCIWNRLISLPVYSTICICLLKKNYLYMYSGPDYLGLKLLLDNTIGMYLVAVTTRPTVAQAVTMQPIVKVLGAKWPIHRNSVAAPKEPIHTCGRCTPSIYTDCYSFHIYRLYKRWNTSTI